MIASASASSGRAARRRTDRVLNRMTSEDQAVLRGMILPSSWYSADVLQRLEMTAAAIVARGDQQALFLEMGRYTAQANLGPAGVQRAYLRADDPHFLLANVPRMYVTQHTEGNRTYEKMRPSVRPSSGATWRGHRVRRTASRRWAG